MFTRCRRWRSRHHRSTSPAAASACSRSSSGWGVRSAPFSSGRPCGAPGCGGSAATTGQRDDYGVEGAVRRHAKARGRAVASGVVVGGAMPIVVPLACSRTARPLQGLPRYSMTAGACMSQFVRRVPPFKATGGVSARRQRIRRPCLAVVVRWQDNPLAGVQSWRLRVCWVSRRRDRGPLPTTVGPPRECTRAYHGWCIWPATPRWLTRAPVQAIRGRFLWAFSGEAAGETCSATGPGQALP